MESLLALSFNNLSSRDNTKIRKGLRQIEGLLAQICLSNARLSPQKRSRSECKQLRDLRKDAAFREFFRLQEGFKWNVASRLVATIERLMGQSSTSATNTLLLSTLTSLHGLLLLHPPSRSIFNREDYMNLLLDLLDSSNPPNIQSQTLLVLVTALLGEPRNTRIFEAVDGLLTVTSLFKSRSTTQEVKMRTLEFLYFYLMPECAPHTSASAPSTTARPRSSSKLEIDGGGDENGDGTGAKTMEDKQKLLGKHLSNVAELVRDLRENAIFAGGAAS
ncbi:hypothetical protein M433DRAFT_63926 [Acidomyces richmondensis BFW]|nr:MAG: hypothetical protein FE78DRAFT_143624 [Acidomyces sp. 'richmondensis']KYG47053.1 hypothetical protein M433DRAFT_63926 [Acidomyces richmondensis BFW]